MSDPYYETHDLHDTKISKDKAKALGSEILLSKKISNEELIILLDLIDASSSESLGKREVIKNKRRGDQKTIKR